MPRSTKHATPPAPTHFVAEMTPMVTMAGEIAVSTFVFIVIGIAALILQEFIHAIEGAGLNTFFVSALTGIKYVLFVMDIVLYFLTLCLSFVKNIGCVVENIKAYLKTV